MRQLTRAGETSTAADSAPPGMARDQIVRYICYLLSERSAHVEWADLSPADWQLVLDVARAEGVAPLAYWHFKRDGWPGAVPDEVREALGEAYRRTAVRNMILFRELDRILATLKEAEVPVIVLKGAALARTVYPDPALRPMVDLDLLVRPRHVRTSVGALTKLGYQVDIATEHIVLGDCSGKGVTVELHWSLFPYDPLGGATRDYWWGQTDPFQAVGGGMARVLAPPAAIPYLAAHTELQHHGRRRYLLALYDLGLSVRCWSSGLGWGELLARAGELGWESALGACLGAAQKNMNLVVPEHVSRKLAASPALFSSAPVTPSIWRAQSALDWRTRLYLAWRLAIPSRRYVMARRDLRPQWLWPLFYVLRSVSAAWAGLTWFAGWFLGRLTLLGRRGMQGASHGTNRQG